MTATLGGDEKLVKALVPNFAVGCRRLAPAIGYLECLRAENVRVVTDPIDSIVGNGVKTATGEVVEIDVLICATGFDVGFCPRFPIVGRKGNLQDLWKENLPRAYMSTSIPDFPNYFSKPFYPPHLSLSLYTNSSKPSSAQMPLLVMAPSSQSLNT